ncbi:homeobox-leucine zipper protein ROC9 [Lolium rigidum]|uniref:homeobox-leucine zipper protein ROC9 n=1 Tax=Lolium rigidum TaxID=89674 RepID=UPI001F5CBFC5|nr:homeobox-leucine zipper protein ROC9 [Lolium rigidum]
MGSSRPRTKDFFAAPTLSLSLAGAFGRNVPAATSGEEVEEGDEGDGGIRDEHLGKEVEISSENTGQGSQSGDGEEEDHYDGGNRKKRSRKSYHRHTAEQVRIMEGVFKESPHPDEKQRQQLSKQLGLSPRQVKFWFQNRRTQIKAIQERHENSLLKSELENLHKEIRAVREQNKRPLHCANCGVAAGSGGDFDAAASNKEQQLQLENARLRAEVEKLRGKQEKAAADGAISPASPPFCTGTIQTKDNRSPLEVYGGGLTGRDKQSILELVGRALEELKTMSSSGEPLWVRSVETGRDILNYDEYVRLFRRDDDDAGDLDQRGAWSVEASRESGVVYLDTTQLVHAFMDANQWKELFPSMIAKASTLDVIRSGEDNDQDGVVQLMLAEVQTLTPMVPTRELCFARYCKKLAPEKWAIVDASFGKAGGGADASSPVITSWKNASGCIIEEQTNGHSRVTWVEHAKHREPAVVPSTYRAVTASGLAFGARRWLAALRLQCERMVFSVATNVPTRDSNGVSTLAGRRSVLKLAHRMTLSLCRVIGGSRDLAWSRAPRAGAGDVWLTSRRNAGDPGEPQGLIAVAVLSTWLPVSPKALLDFLKDESRRPEWDVTLHGRAVQSRVSVAKGKDRGNCVTAYAPTSAEEQSGGAWIVQDVCTNSCESIVAYAPVDAAVLQPVIGGHDSSGVAVLPCGVGIMPDGLEFRPAVITSRKEDGVAGAAGSLVTVACQVLASSSPMAALSPESAETVTSLVSCTLRDIRKSLGC